MTTDFARAMSDQTPMSARATHLDAKRSGGEGKRNMFQFR
jgi:hypothetical protein